MTVAVLGASPNPERHSNMAVRLLTEHHHHAIPINPGHANIESIIARPSLDALAPGEAETITMYVNAERSAKLGRAIIRAAPRRVIFNPGAENSALADELRAAGIEVVEACTLVMLKTGQF